VLRVRRYCVWRTINCLRSGHYLWLRENTLLIFWWPSAITSGV
jgi:hypothetical protein